MSQHCAYRRPLRRAAIKRLPSSMPKEMWLCAGTVTVPSHGVLLLRAFVAISVIVPLAAVIAVSLLPLHPLAKVGIILMSVSPLPPGPPLGCLYRFRRA